MNSYEVELCWLIFTNKSDDLDFKLLKPVAPLLEYDYTPK